MKIVSALLIGAGSVGKRHAKVLELLCDQLVIVDEDPKVERWVAEELGPKAVFSHTIDSGIERLMGPRHQVISIIATLGPSHFEIIEKLFESGIRRVYCEKPLATSVADCRSIVEHAERVGALVTVGLQRRYNGLAREIRRAGDSFLGGHPTSVVAHGGAQCMITNGTHWLDLACDLFKAAPTRVSALMTPHQINPRGENLEMWQGGATWLFSGERTLTMSYDNSSSSDGLVQVYFPLGRIDLNSDGTITMFGRNMDEVARDSRVTRVGDLKMLGPMDVSGLAADPVARALQELADERELTYPLRTAVEIAEAALAALISSHEGMTVDIPVSRSHPLFAHRWAVT